MPRSWIQGMVDSYQQPQEPAEAKCPVYLRLPFLGKVSDHYRRRIRKVVTDCYPDVNPRIILTSRPMLPASTKDVLPSHEQSNLIYLFKCSCDSTYVGRTHQRLNTRIRQHIPVWFEKALKSPKPFPKTIPSSSIAEHLGNNVECGKAYNKSMFSMLWRGRSPFHLQTLEALAISVRRPPLCKQKKFVYSFSLFKHLSSGL